MEKPQKAKIDPKKKCDQAADEFYNSGMRYLAALDELIEVEKGSAAPANQLTVLRQGVRKLETSLHRLFPDEFADTSGGAE
jgi:hypothetical protein